MQRAVLLSALCACTALVAAAPAAAEIAAPAIPVSVKPDGKLGGQDSVLPAVSANGRYVVFTSRNPSLVPMDTNGESDVFRRDLQAGTTELVSKAEGSNESANDSSQLPPRISDDGRYVAFVSYANDLEPLDNDTDADLYVRDMQTGVTELASVNAAGTDSADGTVFQEFSLSADGRFVVFSSSATNMVGVPDANGANDIFRRDLQSNTTELVTINAAGTGSISEPPAGVLGLVASPDGRWVAFHSSASDVAAPDADTDADVFLRDVENDSTALVSANAAGTGSGNANSVNPTSVTPDGRFVAFASAASDLSTVPDANGTQDFFRRDMTTGTTVPAGTNFDGTATANGLSANLLLSSNGLTGVLETSATNLLPPGGSDANGLNDIYLVDFATGTKELISHADGAPSVTANGESSSAQITPDGRYIAYVSEANNLVGGGVDGNVGDGDAYRRDTATDTTRLLSVNFDRTSSSTVSAFRLALMPSGDVGFESAASSLVPAGEDSGNNDIFVARNAAPSGVTLTATPESGSAPLTVAFHGAGGDVEGPVTFEWDFGDGGTATGADATHQFGIGGRYTVTLTAVDRDGARTSATKDIHVLAPPLPPGPGAGTGSAGGGTGGSGTGVLPGPSGAPLISAFTMSRTRFRVAPGATAVSAGRRARTPRGTTVRYTLSKAGGTEIAIEQILPGRRSGTRCVKPTRRNAKKRKCNRYKLGGTLKRSGKQGANTLPFSGRIGTKALRKGKYRATLIAKGPNGERSRPRVRTFSIVDR